jgi:hypothetical protein
MICQCICSVEGCHVVDPFRVNTEMGDFISSDLLAASVRAALGGMVHDLPDS